MRSRQLAQIMIQMPNVGFDARASRKQRRTVQAQTHRLKSESFRRQTSSTKSM